MGVSNMLMLLVSHCRCCRPVFFSLQMGRSDCKHQNGDKSMEARNLDHDVINSALWRAHQLGIARGMSQASMSCPVLLHSVVGLTASSKVAK
ncbi:hypothetical protein F5144DRAFT_585082 [Chaetomium tenue]|uniref:Uncharacterized protein n=1 Tax=Chaetomium tenue TaxID=1854479 RepID=A0ACB7NUX2_9PEZI|nr:hypothetical protein F5144DRAFT_585082 [Chaetomium globosum]